MQWCIAMTRFLTPLSNTDQFCSSLKCKGYTKTEGAWTIETYRIHFEPKALELFATLKNISCRGRRHVRGEMRVSDRRLVSIQHTVQLGVVGVILNVISFVYALSFGSTSLDQKDIYHWLARSTSRIGIQYLRLQRHNPCLSSRSYPWP